MGKGKKTGFFDFLKAVFIAAINKGQLPVLGVLLIGIILAIRVPGESIPAVIDKFIHALTHYHVLGWCISAFLAIAWVFSAKRMRRVHASEMDRISEEKSRMQQKQTTVPLSSSKLK